MLTRLQVSGFKSLIDVDVRFGPFTCVAGPNGVGKSNLFDAIRFLGALASRPLMEAAAVVREQNEQQADARKLFHRHAGRCADRMSFAAEMIVSEKAVDDLGQKARASITSLRYSLELGYRKAGRSHAPGTLEILKEELVHLNRGEAGKNLLFPHVVRTWRRSAVKGARRAPFISTIGRGKQRVIKLHQDGGGDRPLQRQAATLPRTVLSTANAAENPTAVAARREMDAWQILRLEPSALGQPDPFTSPTRMAADGSHLAASLHRLGHNAPEVYTRIANQLAGLIDDVRKVSIDIDEKRQLFTLCAADMKGTIHPAQALSDGTLRFLALAVLQHDPETRGVLCLEEPENGIHPKRIPAILELLADLAVDPEYAVGTDNPLRQVIVNTHSPSVFRQVPEDSVVFVRLSKLKDAHGQTCRGSRFHCLSGTWRAEKAGMPALPLGDILAYFIVAPSAGAEGEKPARKRVVDRDDIQRNLQLVLA